MPNRRRFRCDTPESDHRCHLVIDVIRWLRQHQYRHVHLLIDATGISDRQLRRRFTTAVGYGPKTLQRILRCHHLLALAHPSDRNDLNLASLAIDSGYTDQPHMSRDVQRLTGLPPTAALKRRPIIH